MVEQIKCYCGHTTYCDCGPLEELKQERMYSEKEVYEILAQFVNDAPTVTKEWFEQFKKQQDG